MRRRIGVLVAVFALVGVASGCSLREVQLWFAINKHQAISREQAKNLADLVNSKKPAGGCDGNYAGACVPDNATSVHCVGAPGDGPAVRGPLTIAGWDSFELDPDGDKHVCDSPVGSFDVFGQELGGIAIRGWAFDPDSTDPIQLVVSTNGFIDQIPADGSRGDLAAALPGVGANHGFDLFADGFEGGSSNAVCVVAVNVGTGTNSTLGCKTIVIGEVGDSSVFGHTVFGLLEGADRVPGGIRLRGFVVDDDDPATIPTVGIAPGPGVAVPTSITSMVTLVREDVSSAFGEPADTVSGFDFVVPTTGRYAGANSFCLYSGAIGADGQLMCRVVGT